MITMTEETWNELKARIETALDFPAFSALRVMSAVADDLRAQLAEIDDANTRERYMALAADAQLSLFDVEGVAI